MVDESEKLYDAIMQLDPRKKILLGSSYKNSNLFVPVAEVRLMPTNGGLRLAVSRINLFNQKESGQYTQDAMEATVWVLDIAQRNPSAVWATTDNIEHTSDTMYGDAHPLFMEV